MQAVKTVTILSAKRAGTDTATTTAAKKRVCAYARVSTAEEQQLKSHENQVEYFTDKIQANPKWEFAGIYGDDGKSGTNAKKRPEFMRMINDCKKRKIDLVMIKSLSRFARNILDSFEYIRLLRDLGIDVYFEKENLHTFEVSNEFLISIFSAFAQSESESISENVKRGKRMKYASGKVEFQYKNFLGYEKGADGQPVIVEKQAATVQRIYRRFLNGQSINQIKNDLENDGILTATGKTVWSQGTISNMLKNEKYMGDVITQKTYVKDFLSKKVVKNNGELDKTYISNNHEGIISREMFQQVQTEFARRNNKRKVMKKRGKTENGKYSSKYALTEYLICDECQAPYKRVLITPRNGEKFYAWRCTSRLDFGKEVCKNSETLKEIPLQEAIVRAFNELVENKDDVITLVKNAVKIAVVGDDTEMTVAEIQAELQRLQNELSEVLNFTAEVNADKNHCDTKIEEIARDIKFYKSKLTEAGANEKTSQALSGELDDIYQVLEDLDVSLVEYDDVYIRRLCKEITALGNGKIAIEFKFGVKSIHTLL